MDPLYLAHAGVTLMLVGLIWTIQLVHYPLFAHAAGHGWSEFHADHARRITLIVGLLMPVELLLAGAIVLRGADPLAWLGVGLLAVVWVSTAMFQVPLHNAMARRFDASAHRALVGTNWIRTAAWTMRGGLALGLLQ